MELRVEFDVAQRRIGEHVLVDPVLVVRGQPVLPLIGRVEIIWVKGRIFRIDLGLGGRTELNVLHVEVALTALLRVKVKCDRHIFIRGDESLRIGLHDIVVHALNRERHAFALHTGSQLLGGFCVLEGAGVIEHRMGEEDLLALRRCESLELLRADGLRVGVSQ